MKKIGTIAVVLVLIFTLVACGDTALPEVPADVEQAVEQVKDQVDAVAPDTKVEMADSLELSPKLKEMLEATNSGYEIKDQTLETAEGVNIHYPEIVGYEHESTHDAVNNMIKVHAEQLAKDNIVEDEKNIIDINYEVTMANDALVSIIFKGDGNFEGAAHPWRIFNTINIDVINGKTVKLSDFYTIDENLIDVALENSLETDSAIKEGVTQFIKTDDTIMDTLKGIDTDTMAYSYYREDKIGISIPVIHALGDFMVFEIPVK